ncbi:hypothetical protein [Salegentibacter sp. F14]
MIKRFIVIVAVLTTAFAAAQENISSPYSYYGIGLTKFKGTIENRSMGGLSVFSDSIHLNLNNPAGYGRLRRTTYAIAGSHERSSLKSDMESDKAKITSLDYLSLGIPVGKFGFGFGLIPETSVGYRILDIQEDVATRLQGRGGLNRVYLSGGYEINRNFSIGIDARYNFGNFQNRRTLVREEIQLGSRDISRSDLKGLSFNFGGDFQMRLTNGLKLHASATYSPETSLTSENKREVATIAFTQNGEIPVEVRDLEVPDSKYNLAERITVGGGLGRPNKWFFGGEYIKMGRNAYLDRSNTINEAAVYNEATQYKLGGYYIPQYNSLTSYFKRVVIRGGFRYEETGLSLNNEDINEFGITFGLGLPIGPGFSNINLGLEYGQRGTTDSGLIKEDIFRVSVGFSLTEARKWFERRKFD